MPLQRLFETALATASSTGAAQFNFPSPPTMLVWEGTIGIVGPPSGAQFFALVGGSQWCSWNGNNVGGPVQALPGEEVIVTATGLAAGVQYTAQWIGFSVSRDEATLKYPATSSAGGVVSQPPGTSLTVTESGGALRATGTTASATTGVVLAAPATGTTYLLHNVTFTLGSGATLVQLIGHTTGFVYCQAANAAELFSALEGQIVSEALDIVTTGGGGSLWLSYDNGTTAGGASSGGGGSGGGGTVAGGNAWYSSGVDGSVTFDGSSVVLGLTPSSNVYTLARDIVPSLMVVNSGVTIVTNGFRIYVQGSLVNNGHIHRDGNNGATGAGAGNAAGGAALQNSNAPLEGSTATGKKGGDGEIGGGQAGGGDSSHPFAGGNGGTGGNGGGGTGGAFGAGGALGTNEGNIGNPITVSTGLNNGGPFECGGGGGGGSGNTGHAGGGGGGGGGHVVLAAKTISGTGSITANGGNGGNGDPAGNSGGGGGGGGGIVHLISGSVVNGAIAGQTVTANGGSGGTASGVGSTNGGAGAAGFVVLLPN